MTSTLAAKAGQALIATVTTNSDDRAKSGQVYVAATLGNDLFFMGSDKGWKRWTSGTYPVYQSGSLATATRIDFGTLDISGLKGVKLYIGYGVGTGAAAETDALTGKFSSWTIQ